MPAIRQCSVPDCDFKGNHGFDVLPHATRYWHDLPHTYAKHSYLCAEWGGRYVLPDDYRRYLLDLGQFNDRYNDPVWRAGMLARWDKRPWASELARELGIPVAEARRRRDAWRKDMGRC